LLEKERGEAPMDILNEQEMKSNGAPAAGWPSSLLRFLKSINFYRVPRSVRVRETLSLGERRQLLLVEWESRRYLIAASQQGLTVLDSMADQKQEREAQ